MPHDDGTERSFLQVYTLDDQAAVARRGNIVNDLDSGVVTQLTQMLSAVNPYVGQFKVLADSSTPNARLILQAATSKPVATASGHDRRTYSLPTSASDVAVLITGADDEPQHAREVIVHKVAGPPGQQGYELQRIPTECGATRSRNRPALMLTPPAQARGVHAAALHAHVPARRARLAQRHVPR